MLGSSLKAKIIMLAVVSIGVVGAISLIAFFSLSSKVNSYDDLLRVDVQSVILVDKTTIAFKKQVQDWKNVLVRGHTEKDLNKYWGKFNETQRQVQDYAEQVLQSDISPEAKTLVKSFKAEHAKIYEQYRQGYRLYIDNGFDYKQGDSFVRGIDRQPTKDLEAASEIVMADVFKHAESLKSSSDTLVLLGVFMIVLAIAGVGAMSLYITVAKITRPISNIIKNIRRLADGNFDFQVKVRNNDELGEIGESIRQLQRKLVDSTDNINASMEVLKSTDETLADVSDHIRQGTQNQYTRTDQVASAMNEMSSTSKEVAQHAVDAAQASNEAEGAANSGEQVMGSAINTITRMRDHISSTTEVIQTLESNTTEVGTVLECDSRHR